VSTEPGVSLLDVAAIAWTDACAVRQRADGSPVALHRDGERWSVVPTPGTGALTAASAVASNDVWAICRTNDSPSKPLMQHWDGTSWAAVTPPAGIERLSDVAMCPSGAGLRGRRHRHPWCHPPPLPRMTPQGRREPSWPPPRLGSSGYEPSALQETSEVSRPPSG
jgi:hypothetical protein